MGEYSVYVLTGIYRIEPVNMRSDAMRPYNLYFLSTADIEYTNFVREMK
jgi:hypothetical protein